jgi:hypothetical protein
MARAVNSPRLDFGEGIPIPPLIGNNGQSPCRLWAGLIVILIEGDVHQAPGTMAKLRPLGGSQMRAEGAGGVVETRLPQHGQIEQLLPPR